MKIISGMHRSGTSLIARIFYEAGADLGDTASFYQGDKWNPEGYFEQKDIQSVNIPLINGFLWKFAYFRLPSTETILKRSEKRKEQIKQAAIEYKEKVVKETRFCLTLPAWLRQGTEIDGIIVCLRDPIQVARSIKKRNHIPISLALNLWYTHNRRLIEAADKIPLWFVYYRNVMDSTKNVLELKYALHFFGYNLVDDHLLAICKKCVNPRLNHHPQLNFDYPGHIAFLWRQLLEKHNKQFKIIK